MDALRQDLRYALRVLWKDRAFAATTILTLTLCIAANTTIFTVVRSVLLRPLAYPDSERIVSSFEGFPGAGVERAGTSVPNYFDAAAFTDTFEAVALYQFGGFRVGTGASAEGVSALNVTPSYFRVLKTRAFRGRLFTEQEGQVGHDRVAVLSHGFAARQPGGVDAVVGRQLRLNNEPYTVVGVLPRGFTFLNPETQVWAPLAFTAEQRSNDSRYSQNHEQIARLAPSVTLARAQARLDALTARNIERAGPLKAALLNAGYHTKLVPLQEDLVRHIRAALNLLWGGVLFVMLIAAVNITNLSLVRASSRLKEMATRHALGAGAVRLGRQLVTETTLVTFAGGLAGLLLGYWSLDALPTLGLGDMPRAHEVRMDAVVVLFALSLSIVLGVVVGAIPAMQVAGVNLNNVLREEGRTGTSGRGARNVRRLLVTAQVGLAFVLLIGAGLLLVSFQKLLQVNPGFRAEHVMTGRIGIIPSRYPDDPSLVSLTTRALERIRALPGVVAAGATSFLPFSWDGSSSVIIPEGYAAKAGESVVSPSQLYVSSGYLETLRIELKRGRFFNDADAAGSPRVIIVDERLAKRFWPNADPIGRRVYRPERPEDVARPGPGVTWMQVVGVVGSVKLKGLVEGEDARAGAYYIPYAQDPIPNIGLAIRTTGDPAAVSAAVRQALTSIDPEAQLFDVFTMSERIERSLNPRRAPMMLSLAFGTVALLLASLGIYGVLAYQVSQRTREIGVRMALGSDAAAILRLVLKEGALLVAVGLAIGLAGAVALRNIIASQLYGVGALEPRVLIAVIVVLGVASLAACLGPARRAAKVNPVVALLAH
jgi:predicted permease